MSNKMIYFGHPINTPNIIGFLQEMQDTGIEDVFLETTGGDSNFFLLNPGLVMDRNLSIFAGSMICSLGLALYACGEKRYAKPDTVFRFHFPFQIHEGERLTEGEAEMRAMIGDLTGDLHKKEHFSNIQSELKILTNLYAEIISQQAKIEKRVVIQMMRNEEELTVREAHDHGLVHEIKEHYF